VFVFQPTAMDKQQTKIVRRFSRAYRPHFNAARHAGQHRAEGFNSVGVGQDNLDGAAGWRSNPSELQFTTKIKLWLSPSN
jgi:hypothetical protein